MTPSDKPDPAGDAAAGSAVPAAPGVTADEVIYAIEMILGRTPDPGLVDYHLALGFRYRFALADCLIETGEFRTGYAARFNGAAASARPVSIVLGDRVMTETHRGHKIYVAPTDVDLTPLLLQHGRYEPGVEDTIVRLLRPGDTALDIGTNVGYHTIAIAATVGAAGRVYAFEANPGLVPLLNATLYVNGFNRVTLCPKAVLYRAGTISLAVDPAHFSSGHVALETDAAEYGARYSIRTEVDAVRLDDELAGRVGPVDLIHIDIEGSEPLALRGGAGLIERSPQPKIVTEWSVGMMGARADVGEFAGWLVERGFGFWLIETHGKLTGLDPHRLFGLPHCDLLLARGGAAPR